MKELAKVFAPKDIENKWYNEWLSAGCFDRKINEKKQPFCIVIPPPNVTGVLHMGHLLNNTLQDVLVRYARHCNKSALWIPGTDHAGISMQVRVEKELEKTKINYKEIGREKFLQHARKWRDEHGDTIFKQLMKLGVSCDWKNKKHTLDPDYSHGVLAAFIELYKRGYIYRGKRMINWCPASLTALSDEEVKMIAQNSKLYYIKYYVADNSGRYIEVATTRPETIMGDVAVAVNPDDERYKDLLGMYCVRPLSEVKIPIIADYAVSKEFGTGALKITPAHDRVDFEIGQRHNLPMINVLNPDGTLNEEAGKEFCEMDRFVVRKVVADKLRTFGLLTKEEDYQNNVGFSERGNVPIEPRISEQWFLHYPKVEEAKAVVRDGLIKFYPERWTKTYLHWLDNIQDWCISRQLWWGHRIPVWYKKGLDRNDSKNWHVSLEAPADLDNWEQDEDVLDTWFSSWIWPFGVFGWPDHGRMQELGFDYFFPTNDLVTGPDIIFFWVARMIIASLELIGENKKNLTSDEIKKRVPFHNVYFTGIIRDSFGRKMSKSLGNSPEPLELIEKYGADGLRIGLLMSAPFGQDVLFDEERISLGRNFCNKLWNAVRFRLMHSIDYDRSSLKNIVSKIKNLTLDDHSILLQLKKCKQDVDLCMAKYEITSAVQTIYNFFWNDYCDWYVEVSKQRIQRKNHSVLFVHDIVLRQLLLILNPFIPFISEELWHVCKFGAYGGFIQDTYCESSEDITSAFEPLRLDANSLYLIEQKREFINACRLLISQNKHLPSKEIKIVAQLSDSKILDDVEVIRRMLNVGAIEQSSEQLNAQAMVTTFGTIYISSLVNKNYPMNQVLKNQQIFEEMKKVDELIALNETKLKNKNFTEKAPKSVIEGARKLLQENIDRKKALNKTLNNCKNY